MLLGVNPIPERGRRFSPGGIAFVAGFGGGAPLPAAGVPGPLTPVPELVLPLGVGRCATLGPLTILGPPGRPTVGELVPLPGPPLVPKDDSRRREEEMEGVREGGSEGLRAGGDVPRAAIVPVGVRRPPPVGVLRPLGGGDVAGGDVAVRGGGGGDELAAGTAGVAASGVEFVAGVVASVFAVAAASLIGSPGGGVLTRVVGAGCACAGTFAWVGVTSGSMTDFC